MWIHESTKSLSLLQNMNRILNEIISAEDSKVQWFLLQTETYLVNI
jgi:hypothetical protein